MNSGDRPKQLFDYSLSNGSNGVWNANTTYNHGCEIVTTDAKAQLRGMVDQFQTGESGWYVLLLEITGFKGSEWVNKGETLKAIVGPLVPNEGRTWVYLLGGTQLGVLVRSSNKPLLVGLVQKLGAALAEGQGSPRTRMAEIPAQKQVVKDYLDAQDTALENQKRLQQKADAVRRVAAMDFELQDGIAAKRATRIRPVVLLVEDDPTTLQLLKHLVSQVMVVEVLAVSNATDAALLYRRNAPDLVFLDIGLPEIDGLTLLGKLREADAAAQVVILTANAYRNNLNEASRLGATGFLAKPFTPAKIAEVMKQVLSRKGTA
ncbi:MAG: response regulator [Sphingobacteriales bacterium]|nr:MAG: response regulator [Sphingobacteriales bacterium]